MKEGWYTTKLKETNLEHTISSHILNFYYKDGEWYEHSDCHEDSRCTGYVGRCCTVIGPLDNPHKHNTALVSVGIEVRRCFSLSRHDMADDCYSHVLDIINKELKELGLNEI